MIEGRRLLGNSIAREQWLLREIQIVARLRLEGLNEAEITQRIKAENLFQYPTERTLGKISRACNKRIDATGSERIVRIVASGEPEAAAQANLYMMMCAYPLVRHFMLEEIACRYSDLNYVFSDMDMNAYFTRLESEFENFATSAETTTAKLKQVLRKCLVECGMLATVRSEELIPVFLDPEVRAAIEDKNDFAALRAFNCQEVF